MKKNINLNVTINSFCFRLDLKVSESKKQATETKITTRVHNILSIIQTIESIGNIKRLLIALPMSLNIL